MYDAGQQRILNPYQLGPITMPTKTKLQEEIDYLTEVFNEWSEDEVIDYLIECMDEGVYDGDRSLKTQIRELGIERGTFIEVTQAQLDSVITSDGKKTCDFRLRKKMYVYSDDLCVS